MKINRYFWLSLIVCANCCVGCGAQEKAFEQNPYSDEASYQHALVMAPHIPTSLQFAGETIDLTRYDRRERLDREVISFAYAHTTSLLMIKRANRYFPEVEPILKAAGVPDDFKYLMAIESFNNPLARSGVGAAGLWQFMESTGKEYGLEINAYVDERYNTRKATEAACKYLKDAYAKTGDWISVAASYNAGQSRIKNELEKQKAKSAMDLWLNTETSRYMYRILAAKAFFQNPKDFGFLLTADQLYPPMEYTEVMVDYPIEDLTAFAQQYNITYADLKTANPWLRDRSLPNKTKKKYYIAIPTQESLYYNPSKIKPHHKEWIAH